MNAAGIDHAIGDKNDAVSMTPAAPLIRALRVRVDGLRRRNIPSAPMLVPRPANKLAIAPSQKTSEFLGSREVRGSRRV
jgi:hypothetical protein